MKMMKRFSALALAIVMMLAMTVTAFATEATTGKITIKNAAKGETYNVYQLFSATVDRENGAISYKGTIPQSLTTYFEYMNGKTTDEYGIQAKAGADAAERSKALYKWTKTATAAATPKVADGNTVEFTNLPYGYYVITSTNGKGTEVSVTSTNPEGIVNEKNESVPTVDSQNGKKITGDDKVYVGEQVTYTLTFTTSNYIGKDTNAKLVTDYIINDTLPAYLKDVNVTKIAIKQADEQEIDYKVNNAVPQFQRTNNQGAGTITIPWVDANKQSLYKNGTVVEVTYTATVTDQIAIAGQGNANTFSLSYKLDGDTTPTPVPENGSSTETIYTYAIVIKKIDGKGNPLKDAEFSVSGLQAKATLESGVYFVNGKTSVGGTDTVMKTDENGILILKGVDNATYAVTEVTAPSGYNKLQNPVNVEAQESSATSTTKYWSIDANGNYRESDQEVEGGFKYTNDQLAATVLPIVNMKGSILPSTGGIGTTIFYVVGGILVAVAVVLLVTKKRMSNRA